jgi:hypothetical protein
MAKRCFKASLIAFVGSRDRNHAGLGQASPLVAPLVLPDFLLWRFLSGVEPWRPYRDVAEVLGLPRMVGDPDHDHEIRYAAIRIMVAGRGSKA